MSLIPWKKNNRSLALRPQQTVDPFTQLRQEIDQMFNSVLGDWSGRMNLFDRAADIWMPSVDIKEAGKEVRITAELPGMEQKDLEVSFVDGTLTIKGEKRSEQEEEKSDVYHSECHYGMFERTIPLPAEIDVDNVKASFKNGVLRIALPKTKDAQSNRRVISVES